MQLYDEVTLNETEQQVLVTLLSNPTMIKYLKGLAQEASISALTAYDRVTIDPQKYTQQGIFLQGQVATISQLLELAVKE